MEQRRARKGGKAKRLAIVIVCMLAVLGERYNDVLKLERRPIASGNVPSPGPGNLSSRSRVRSDSHDTSVRVFGSSQLLNFNTSEWCVCAMYSPTIAREQGGEVE